jgi:signal transduction histidine kinase
MSSFRLPTWPLIAAVPLLTAAVLGWLLLGFAGARPGLATLPGLEGASVSYFIEQGAALTVEDAPTIPWRAWSGDFLSANRGQTFWVRVTLPNPTGTEVRGVLENDDYFTDRAEMWVLEHAPRPALLSGEAVPTAQKALGGREIAWPVTLPAHGERTVILRLENFFGAYTRLVWWPAEARFHVYRGRLGLAEGVYLGGMLALLGYNTLLWLRLRQPDIGYYVLYLGMAAAFMALSRAHLPALGWALGSPGLEAALNVVMILSAFFLVRFTRVFLELEARYPRIDRFLRAGSLALPLIALGILLTPAWRWMACVTPTVGAIHLLLLGLAVASWRAGVWQARFFLISFGCLFSGSLLTVGVWFWGTLYRDLAMRGLMIGSALEMLLLSLALADRFARTQWQLVHETEQRRMIEETYADELEIEVNERTRELQAANDDKDRILAVLGHDLRSPLTGLTRSADMASGEFARDAARTGRELLLMIEDLVLWARLRAGSRSLGTHPASAVMVPAAALHRSLADHSGVALHLDVPEDLHVSTDLVLSQTLVRNLVANALKFAKRRVTLRAAAEPDGGARFTVGNDGPALPPAVAARLAAGVDGPFTATNGLGLRLCREICQALDMHLEATSLPEGGAQFSFTMRQAPASTTLNPEHEPRP